MSSDKVVCSRHSCRLSIAQGTVDVPIRLFRQNLMLAPRCSRALLHNLQPASDRRLILASHLVTVGDHHWSSFWFSNKQHYLSLWSLWWSLQLPSFLAFYVSKGRAGRPNTSLRTIYFHSAVMWSLLCTCHHDVGWLILSCSALACTHDPQEFSVINLTGLLQDLYHVMVRCLISLLVCAVLYVIITFTPYFISSPECADLSPSTCKLLFMFLHLTLRCPSSYFMPHDTLL